MLESILHFFLTPVVLWSTALAVITVYFLTGRPKNLPPGPRGLPLLGYAPFLSSKPHLKMKELAETYGDIMCLNLAGKTVVVLNSFDAARAAFVEKGYDFAGRPQDASFIHWIVDGLGIIQTEGAVWKEHRRFALHTLKDFGFGKLSLEQRVQDIADDLIDVLLETKGEPHDLENDLSITSTNVICSLTFSKHYKKDDPDFIALRQRIKKITSQQGASIFLEGVLLRVLPRRFVPGFSVMQDIKTGMHELCDKLIGEHQESFDADNLRDYVDVYLNERRIMEKEGKLEESTFSLERLRAIALNLFLAGSETTSTTMHWALKLMAVHQDVQKRIQAELDHVIGRERRPSILDRPKLQYTEAAILEVHRFASMLILFPPHSNPEESELCGYTIPKRSLIIVNGWAMNRDQRHYVNPDEFNPARFLGPDGRVDKQDTLIPFSIGKRSCPGESLARMEVFLFLTVLLQRFSFELPEGVEPNLNHTVNFVRRLSPYQLCAKPRN